MSLRLIGYRHSVYSWSVRMALAELGRAADWEEFDPFDPAQAEKLRHHHPFGRVPVLYDGLCRIYETGAILEHLFAHRPKPEDPVQARQAAGIADSYVYWVLVRQVFSHGVFLKWSRLDADPERLAAGLAAAPAILSELERIAARGRILTGTKVDALDCHLAPMIGYFSLVPEGAVLLSDHQALRHWFHRMTNMECYQSTRPPIFKELAQ